MRYYGNNAQRSFRINLLSLLRSLLPFVLPAAPSIVRSLIRRLAFSLLLRKFGMSSRFLGGNYYQNEGVHISNTNSGINLLQYYSNL